MGDRVFYTNSPSDGQIIEFDADTLAQTTIAFAAATYNFRLFYAPWCMSVDQHRLYFIESNGNIGGKVRVGYLTNCGGFQRVDLFELDNTPFGGLYVTGYKNSTDDRFYLQGSGSIFTYDETGTLLNTNTSFFDSDYQFQGGYLGQSELSVKAISGSSPPNDPDFAFGMVGDVTASSGGVGPTWDTDLGPIGSNSRGALPGAAVRLSDHHGWLIFQEIPFLDPSAIIRIFEVYEDTLIGVTTASYDFALHTSAAPGLGGLSTDSARMYSIALELGTGIKHICVGAPGGSFTTIATTGVSPFHLIVGDEHFDDCSAPGGLAEYSSAARIWLRTSF